MVQTLVVALIAAGLGGVFLAPLLTRRPGLQAHCMAFAAGVLVAVIFAHIIPESVTPDHPHGGAAILAGFVAMMLLQQKVLKADPCCGHEHAKHAGLPSYLALVACAINDGIILNSVDHVTHPLVWAMCAHKLTATFALVMLLRETSAGLKPRTQMLYMLIFVLISPAVVLASHELEFLAESMHYPVAVGAGALLYVVCGGMIPRVEHLAQDGKPKVLLTFLLAAAITIVVELVAPHHHHHSH